MNAPNFTITAGKFYRTRDGRKARIYATDGGSKQIHGAIMDDQGWIVRSWNTDGTWITGEQNESDLIAEWTDKPTIDWPKLAAYHKFVAMDENGDWRGYRFRPESNETMMGWAAECGDTMYLGQIILPEYAPTWTGDWHESLIERPTQ